MLSQKGHQRLLVVDSFLNPVHKGLPCFGAKMERSIALPPTSNRPVCRGWFCFPVHQPLQSTHYHQEVLCTTGSCMHQVKGGLTIPKQHPFIPLPPSSLSPHAPHPDQVKMKMITGTSKQAMLSAYSQHAPSKYISKRFVAPTFNVLRFCWSRSVLSGLSNLSDSTICTQ